MGGEGGDGRRVAFQFAADDLAGAALVGQAGGVLQAVVDHAGGVHVLAVLLLPSQDHQTQFPLAEGGDELLQVVAGDGAVIRGLGHVRQSVALATLPSVCSGDAT